MINGSYIFADYLKLASCPRWNLCYIYIWVYLDDLKLHRSTQYETSSECLCWREGVDHLCHYVVTIITISMSIVTQPSECKSVQWVSNNVVLFGALSVH